MAAANISVTPSRAQVMDFSQPIYTTGLQIVTHANQGKIAIAGAPFATSSLAFAVTEVSPYFESI